MLNSLVKRHQMQQLACTHNLLITLFQQQRVFGMTAVVRDKRDC
jgi:hypothetical protein